jgi:hypothetical protein
MRTPMFLIAMTCCLAAPALPAQERDGALPTGAGVDARAAAAVPRKPASPIGRALERLLQAADDPHARAAPQESDSAAPPSTPDIEPPGTSDASASAETATLDQVAVH